jgi:hypothetical protein
MLGTAFMALALLRSSCGGSGSPNSTSGDPGEAMLSFLGYAQKGQWGRSWDHLLAEHQAVVSRTAYDVCLRQVDAEIPADAKFEVDEVYDESVDVPGLGNRQTKAVTWTLSAGGDSASRTTHVIKQDGEWKWMLPPSDYASYKAGDCPNS